MSAMACGLPRPDSKDAPGNRSGAKGVQLGRGGVGEEEAGGWCLLRERPPNPEGPQRSDALRPMGWWRPKAELERRTEIRMRRSAEGVPVGNRWSYLDPIDETSFSPVRALCFILIVRHYLLHVISWISERNFGDD
jgi:hypothetical protein